MANIKISELLDGEPTRLRSAEVPFEQGGITFRGSSRPNPPEQINVTSQAQLEAEFGSNLEIPDGTSITIVVDEEFELTKPFKLGNNVTFEIYSATERDVITLNGINEPLFQRINPTDRVFRIHIHDMDFITVAGSPILFDLLGVTFNSTVILEKVEFHDFMDLGTLEDFFAYDFRTLFALNPAAGLKIINSQLVSISGFGTQQEFAGNTLTLLSFISNMPSRVTLDNVSTFGHDTGDTLFFLDPNSPAGSNYNIRNCTIDGGDFYQTGTSQSIISVFGDGSGNARFKTSTPHGFSDGQVVVHSGFATSAYNGTHVIKIFDTDEYDVIGVPVGATETGTVDVTSLDSTDVQVLAQNNPMQPDSMFTGDAGLEVFAAPIVSSSLAQNAFEVITSASWAYNNLERFSIGVNNEGQLIANDLSTRRYKVDYSATLEKAGGGSLNIGIVILKNGSIISFNPPHTVNSGLVQISGSDIIELSNTDTIQIAVINYDSTAAVINTSQVNMVINRA